MSVICLLADPSRFGVRAERSSATIIRNQATDADGRVTMPTGVRFSALLCLLPTIALASAPPIPGTPVGHALRSWLDVFNSGDSARIDSFDRTHAPWLMLPGMMRLRSNTGGYDLQSIEKGGRFWIVFRMRERKTSAGIVGSMVVRSYEPDHITLLSLVSAGAHPDGIVLDKRERFRVIDGAVRLLDEYYVFPDLSRKVSTKLRALQKRGEYKGITDGDIFATRLGDDLVALSGDKHIGVDYFAKSMPHNPAPRPQPDPRQLAASHCGFERSERLPPNIGYVKLTYFAEPGYCTQTAISTMSSLADSDALIIDLRDDHGGAPKMAALITSYLFDKPTHLDDIYYPHTHSIEQQWTDPRLPGRRFTGKPVYVLTSSSTFSAAEELSYDLKSLKRATVVGETTGGGAHPEAPHRIDDHFFIRIPYARVVNPITKTDWEGSGVQPDVKVPAADALTVAEKLAAGRIGKDTH